MFKKIWCFWGICMTILFLSACGQKKSQTASLLEEITVPEGRTLVTIGDWTEEFMLKDAVTKFNLQNDKYWVYIIPYNKDGSSSAAEMDACKKRMQMDVTTGEACPDLILLNNYYLNVSMLIEDGYLEDLNPYLNESSIFDRADFLESVLDAYTFDGKLIAIPKHFMLHTLVGRESQLSHFQSWTTADMLAYGTEYPDASLLFGDYLYDYLQTLSLYKLPFVKEENGAYTADKEQITQFLELIKRAGELPDPKVTYYPKYFTENHVLLCEGRIKDFYDIQFLRAMFTEDISYIGYPSNTEKNVLLEGKFVYGIPVHAKQKDGAWAFLEFYLENAERMQGLFSTKTVDFEWQKQEALTHEGYIENEQGVLVTIDGGFVKSTYGMDDWQYQAKAVTEKDIALAEALIADAGNPFLYVNHAIPWMEIFNDEAPAYLEDQKSLEEVVDIIAGRLQIYMNEQK